MLDIDRFIEDCQAARAEADDHKAVREMLARAMDAPGEVLDALGAPDEAGIKTLHRSDQLTILNVVWAPLMTLKPHNHNMWALIGIYTGREDNIFWRKSGETVSAAGARSLMTGDVETLGEDIVHSVNNPIDRLTGAIHIYGGDFFAPGRSEWDPETLTRQPFDMERNLRLFQEANARFHAANETA